MLRLLAAIPLILLGDIAPPVGFVENCTVEKQKKSGEECVSCATFFAEADKCVRDHGSRGFEFRCKTRGGSKWSEVWCKSASRTVISSLKEPAEGGAPTLSDGGGATPVTRPSSTTTPPTSTSTSEPPATPTPIPAETAKPIAEPSASPHRGSPEPPAAAKHGGCGACAVDGLDPNRVAPWTLVIGLAV